MASCNHKELVAYFCRGVEPASTGFDRLSSNRDFFPSQSLEIENPEIIEICDTFASKYHEVGIKQFSTVISTGPRSRFIGFGTYFYPLFGLPIQEVDRVEALLVDASSPKHHQLFIILVVVHGGVRTVRGNVASGFDFGPFHGDSVERPEVVHVVGV